MRRRDIRAARLDAAKRDAEPIDPPDWWVDSTPSDAEPMTAERYAQDQIDEHAAPQIPGNY